MKPDIPIFLAGAEYRLRPTTGNIIRAEEELESPISQIPIRMSVKQMSIILKHTIYTLDEKRLTPEEWGEIVEKSDLNDTIDAVGKLLDALAPKKTKTGGEGEKN